MTIISRLLGNIARLSAPTSAVSVERDLKATMPDGVVLLADRYVPRGIDRPPLILVRCCYGRRGFWGLMYGRIFAERGFQVVIQSTRGTFDSGGIFNPQGDEHDDGLATVAWLKEQPWYPGTFLTNGPSYLGLVQWAIASEVGSDLQGMAIQISASEFRSRTYAGEAFSLQSTLSWSYLILYQEHTSLLKRLFNSPSRRLQPLFNHLPLRDLDRLATGQSMQYFQDCLAHNEPGDAYWQVRNFSGTLKDITAPVNLVGGWYDIFLPRQLNDYRALREAGRTAYLTIGPWGHSSQENMFYGVRESLAWLQAVAQGRAEQYRENPVRLFVTGANEWRDFADWPPPGVSPQRWYLQPAQALAPTLPAASEPDRYRYDPADPTPSLSGPLVLDNSLPVDNRSLESRADVLIYTSAVLEQDLEVIGPVQAELSVRSSLDHTDFFVRLCDVDEQGISLNVCDGILRLKPGTSLPETDGTHRIHIDLWSTAHCFKAGHRLRIQISSGAHPRIARNTGSGEPLGTATTLLVADQEIYHDPDHPSALVLSK